MGNLRRKNIWSVAVTQKFNSQILYHKDVHLSRGKWEFNIFLRSVPQCVQREKICFLNFVGLSNILDSDFCGRAPVKRPLRAGSGGCAAVWTGRQGAPHFRLNAASGNRCMTGFYCTFGWRRIFLRTSLGITDMPCLVLCPCS